MPDITLYTAPSPNGTKISIALEELGLPYTFRELNIYQNEQKEDWYLAINPNGRIPAVTDVYTDGKPIHVFESGSIMQYLVERYDTDHKISYPRGTREWTEMISWLFFQNAGVGPMQGQANHFNRYASEHVEYGVKRYTTEAKRLYSVLEKHLASDNRPYLVGEKCTIADIAHYPWVYIAGWSGIEIDNYPALKAWEERMASRPGVQRGSNVPQPAKFKELIKDKAKGEEFASHGRKWVAESNQQEAEKYIKR